MTEVIIVSEGQLLRNIEVQAGQKTDMLLLVMPGVSCDIRLDVRLAGEGAEANVYGAYVCGGQEKVKIAVDMRHDVPYCNSRQLFKGIAGGDSRVDFYGKIIVAQDAQRTEAYQENHNILLSDGARVDTKPQLEIYADDVKCSHGSTVGQLDENALFYMQQRGIPADEARHLLMYAFAGEVIESIRIEALRDRLHMLVEKRLRSELNHCKRCAMCK